MVLPEAADMQQIAEVKRLVVDKRTSNILLERIYFADIVT